MKRVSGVEGDQGGTMEERGGKSDIRREGKRERDMERECGERMSKG
jgi:hypothetical protein